MKKLGLLLIALSAAALLFVACTEQDASTDEAPQTEKTEAVAPADDTTEEPTTLAESDDDFVIEPVTLKTEPAEEITEDVGEIGDYSDEDNPDIPEENDIEENVGEGVIPEESSETIPE